MILQEAEASSQARHKLKQSDLKVLQENVEQFEVHETSTDTDNSYMNHNSFACVVLDSFVLGS